jgi:hypothetical protein
VEGGAGRLTGELQHYSYRNLDDHLERINRYTTLAARQMYESGRRARVLDLVIHPPAAFLRNYVLRRGFADGTAGLTISLVNAYSVLLKFAKLWELDRKSQIPNPKSQIPTPKPNPASEIRSPESEVPIPESESRIPRPRQ